MWRWVLTKTPGSAKNAKLAPTSAFVNSKTNWSINRKEGDMRNRLFSQFILVFSLFVIAGATTLTARAQEVKGSPNANKVPDSNLKKSPGTVTPLVPKLRLRNIESHHIGGSDPKDFHKISFTFFNWDSFPAKWFEPAPESAQLPPNPCRQIYTPTRMFIILHSADGKTTRCTALNSKADFYFLFEKGKPVPDSIYVEVTDRTNGMKFKSTPVTSLSDKAK
jgi:hypothetical protein